MAVAPVKNLTFLASQLGNYPAMAPLVRAMPARYPAFFSPRTELVIEGFPRSGNSFFVNAFSRWNPGVALAHHSHLAASPKLAAQRQVPVALMLRDPVDAVASVVAWDGKLSPALGLWAYGHYYRTLWDYRRQFQVVPFEIAVSTPQACVEAINRRFGRDYQWRSLEGEEQRAIRANMENRDRRRGRGGPNATLPSEEKGEHKQRYAQRLQASRWMAPAREIYHRYLELAD